MTEHEVYVHSYWMNTGTSGLAVECDCRATLHDTGDDWIALADINEMARKHMEESDGQS